MEENESRKFLCFCCKFRVKYNYFGKKPPFAKSLVLMEDTYVMKDPFNSDGGMITLGSHCHLCTKSVCASPDCSIFYSKRFCLPCVMDSLEEFPTEIQQEVQKRNSLKR